MVPVVRRVESRKGLIGRDGRGPQDQSSTQSVNTPLTSLPSFVCLLSLVLL